MIVRTAGKDAKTYKVSIPSAWAAAMGISDSEKEIECGSPVSKSIPFSLQR